MAGVACGGLDQDDDFDVVLGVVENSGGNPIYFNESNICADADDDGFGDANGDGTVDFSDAVYLIAYIFSGGSAPCTACK